MEGANSSRLRRLGYPQEGTEGVGRARRELPSLAEWLVFIRRVAELQTWALARTRLPDAAGDFRRRGTSE